MTGRTVRVIGIEPAAMIDAGAGIDLESARLAVYAVNNLPALLDVAEALERLLANPYGCRFCDAGVLRKFQPHDDNCEWEQAREALARLKESQ